MDDPLAPEELQKYWAVVADGERERIETVQGLKDHLMRTLENRRLTATYELPVLKWLDIIDEIQNRHPKGFSALFRDYTIDRLNAAIERIHEEVNYMVASGPADSVAERYAGGRSRHSRNVAGKELSKMVKKWDK